MIGVRECCARHWPSSRHGSCGFPELTMAVNLSAIQFRQPQLPELVSRVLMEFDLPPIRWNLSDGRCGCGTTPLRPCHHGPPCAGVRMSMDGLWHGLLVTQPAQKRFQIFAESINPLCAT